MNRMMLAAVTVGGVVLGAVGLVQVGGERRLVLVGAASAAYEAASALAEDRARDAGAIVVEGEEV